MPHKSTYLLIATLFSAANGLTDAAFADEERRSQYTFAWPYAKGSSLAPRGGTTKGPELTLQSEASAQWTALSAPNLTAKDRDRLAILAMAGPYRATFDFIETHGFTANYQPPRPYQSWGTEFVYVIADEEDFISLQHILVMKIQREDGTLSDPHVVKHWRQDWRYQDRDLHEYQGHSRWRHKKLSRKETKGTWTQAVFQVDDSPRYESFGSWEHGPNYSSWQSQATRRPLPRREFSVRDDYDVLVGTNRHTITPHGWVHEEANRKVVLDEQAHETTSVAVEAGFNRYERIEGFDFTAGDNYWKRTAPFWEAVRQAWDDIFTRTPHFELATTLDGKSLFGKLFAAAERSGALEEDDLATEVERILSAHLNTLGRQN